MYKVYYIKDEKLDFTQFRSLIVAEIFIDKMVDDENVIFVCFQDWNGKKKILKDLRKTLDK